VIGVIADDLTGAAELGAVGLRYGLRAEIVLSGAAGGEADLVCVDTNSRSCAPQEAGRRAAAAADLLRGAGAEWIYKKVDSVLRGEVAAELAAVMGRLGVGLALLAPANPSLGRTIRGGRYLIHGKPIDETEFARDPEHPRVSSQVIKLLGTSEACPICVRRVEESLPVEGIVIAEAETPGDLGLWAARRSPKLLVAGGAEFFGALLAGSGEGRGGIVGAAARQGDSLMGRPRSYSGGELFVCGSMSESGREFVSAARVRGTPVFSLPQELARGADLTAAAAESIIEQAVKALAAGGRVILNVGLPPVSERTAARLLAVRLVEVAESVLSRTAVERVYVEGGATAVELARRMGWARLAVLDELAPGVARLAPADHGTVVLTIKPGTYVWPEAIVKG
jgi:uncharacterized protein YgbK (DUF1537 family)